VFDYLKRLWWDLRTWQGRLEFTYEMVRNLPGHPGTVARCRLLTPRFVRCGKGLLILTGARFRNPHKITCGDHVLIGNDVLIQAGGGLELGDNVMLGPGVHIWTQNHRFDDPEVPVARQGYQYAAVKIGRDCWIGTNAIILPGVVLPRGCVVSAGSVVGVKPYKDFSILMGNPARVIGFRGKTKGGEGDSQTV
jgi:acetyltransferase-like isoleucine patch superfamily enzyme